MPFAREHAKSLRLAAGISAAVMGRTVGADGRTVRRWEAGDTEPTLSAAGRMARALGVPLDDLFDEIDHDRSLNEDSTAVGNPAAAHQAPTESAAASPNGG